MNTDSLRWLSLTSAVNLHEMVLEASGGCAGVRDVGLVARALDQPMNYLAYWEPEVSVFDLAARYCVAIVRGHPFVDGNKRTAFLAALTFLMLNGHPSEPPESEVADMMVAVAEKRAEFPEVTAWLAANKRDQ
jgi:death-on-curing protein